MTCSSGNSPHFDTARMGTCCPLRPKASKQVMTIDEAYEYEEHAHETESELRAEFGMGAQSMGWNGSDWMAAYDGYRTADDPQYVEAQRIIKEHEADIASRMEMLMTISPI